MAEPSIPAQDPAPTVPQKRPLEDEHAPSVSSPLNPEPSTVKSKPAATAKDSKPPIYREPREKKESLKKREAKDASSPTAAARGTPTPGTVPNTTPQASSAMNPPSTPSSKLKPSLPSGPLRYKLPPPKPLDYIPPKPPVLTPSHLQQSTQFHSSSEHVYNRKGFRYTHCIADPLFPSSLYYRQSDAPPFTPRINYEDSSSHILFNTSATHITTQKGFRMARANVGIREGRWYWECRVTSGIPFSGAAPNGHIRIGFARREAPLDAPVGFDAYSYGLRDVGGQKVHMSRPVDFLTSSATPNSESAPNIIEGDILGLEISLPPLSLHQKIVSGDYNPAVDAPSHFPSAHEPDPAPDIIRDRVPIHYKSNLYFESYEYHSTKELEELTHPSPHPTTSSSASTQPPNPTHPSVHLRTLPGSYIKVYRNGKPIGKPFENLLAFLPPASKPQNLGGGVQAREGLDDGLCGYFPAVSVFLGGAGECNFGPDWWAPPENDEEKTDKEGDVAMRDEITRAVEERRPVSKRYDEQIAEDVVWDLIDEVDFWLQDGAGSAAPAGAVDAAVGGAGAGVAAAVKIAAPARGSKTAATAATGAATAISGLDGADDIKAVNGDADGDVAMDEATGAIPAGITELGGTDLAAGETEEIKELIQEDE